MLGRVLSTLEVQSKCSTVSFGWEGGGGGGRGEKDVAYQLHHLNIVLPEGINE